MRQIEGGDAFFYQFSSYDLGLYKIFWVNYSYAGTITGIEDLDPVNWPTSKWRSLKVNWDDMFNNEGQDRVSPWEIELCISPPVSNPSPVANPPQIRNKRFRPAPSSELPGLILRTMLICVPDGFSYVFNCQLNF
jgi:hypothetical protein